jgi:hypothetical protein
MHHGFFIAAALLTAAIAHADPDTVKVKLPGNTVHRFVELYRKRSGAAGTGLLRHLGRGAGATISLRTEAGTWTLDGKAYPGSLSEEEARDLLAPWLMPLAVKPAPDGSAAAISFDGGKTWRVVYLEASPPLLCMHRPPVAGPPDAALADRTAPRALALSASPGSDVEQPDGHDDGNRLALEIRGEELYLRASEEKAADAWLKLHAQDREVAAHWKDPEVQKREDAARGAALQDQAALHSAALADADREQRTQDRAYVDDLHGKPVGPTQRMMLLNIAERVQHPLSPRVPTDPQSSALLRDVLAAVARYRPNPTGLSVVPPSSSLVVLAQRSSMFAAVAEGPEIRGWALRGLADEPAMREAVERIAAQEPCELPDDALPELHGGPPPAQVRPPGCEAKATLARVKR